LENLVSDTVNLPFTVDTRTPDEQERLWQADAPGKWGDIAFLVSVARALRTPGLLGTDTGGRDAILAALCALFGVRHR
jgi:hypothetical protein